jgi:antirestriction protein ArdC
MDVYAIVTNKIVNLLQQEVIPWRRPWTSLGLPRNLVSQKPYRGINHFLLSASKYLSPFWLTMRQANQLGGHVRKGEESTLIIYWKIENSQRDDEDPDMTEDTVRSSRRILLRYYRLFNFEQCELPQSIQDNLPKIAIHEHGPISACAEIMGCMPKAPQIEHGGSKAFYSSLTDRINLPKPELFTSAEEYYATAFHELIHSTGHQKRLARESILEAAPFGSPIYSREELVGELGTAFLCAEAGISPSVICNQASYIAGWLKTLRDDRRLMVHAAAHAQRAADFVLGRIPIEV